MKSNMLFFRAEAGFKNAVQELAQKQGYTVSELLRIVIRAYAESKGYNFK
ncbi:MAG: hypothetical protein RL462_1136 [Pseudomonadota bacterium]|jgi:antitoxin component of RelBE/YafQ-DinJ toxin-antitoxin module